MHDIKAIRANPDAFRIAMQRRGFDALALDVLAHDALYRRGLAQIESANATINDASNEIRTISQRVPTTSFQIQLKTIDTQRQKDRVAQAKKDILDHKALTEKAQEQRDIILSAMPNQAAPDVPDGRSEAENRLVHDRGDLPSFDFLPLEHDALAIRLGYDPDAAAAIAGARFAVLKGPIARLHRALGQWMLDTQVAAGYTEVAPPLLVKADAVYGVGQLPKFEDDLFKTTDGRYLISTSEVSLTNLVRERILDADDLPLRFTALTPCFRSEAGSAGRDTRGLIRQHQFEKVELVCIVADQDAATAEHERMVRHAEVILKALGLAYRRMLLCAGDMGFAARKTYDLEVWLPGQGQYREISSVSDCGDFQARRMDARWKARGEKGTKFVHTLNGSGLAVGRTLVAVLENFQQADGSVRVPEVLRPYMGGIDALTPG